MMTSKVSAPKMWVWASAMTNWRSRPEKSEPGAARSPPAGSDRSIPTARWTGCTERGTTAPAPDVQHRMVRLERAAGQQRVAEGDELAVVAVGMIDLMHGLNAVPCLELVLVRAQRNPFDPGLPCYPCDARTRARAEILDRTRRTTPQRWPQRHLARE